MKKLIVSVLVMILWAIPVLAEQRYNAMEDRWETTSKCEDTLTYNSMENEWTYENEDAELEYNPFENDWSYVNDDCGKDSEY